MSDPRYPSAFQRPGSGSVPMPAPAPAPEERTTAPAAPEAAPARPPVDVVVPAATDSGRPRTSARTAAPQAGAAPEAHSGNRIVLLGCEVLGDDDEPSEPRRNLALIGLYALAGALLLLALLGGWWSQGYLRGVDPFTAYGTSPDGLSTMQFDGVAERTAGIARLLVQLAPTTLALGVLALLVAIVLPVLTRRPR